jgi:protein transport protein SEC13
MSKTVITFDTEHEGMINDCQFDYYGLRIASCDSNGFVQVYSIEKDEINKSSKANFSAHAGPAWQVAWAHPKYESIIATCGYDKKINIWKEVKQQLWDLVYQIEAAASVNAISWAPWEYGLILAAGSADGKIHIIQRKGDDNWSPFSFDAHDGGVNSISWGPSTDPSMLS